MNRFWKGLMVDFYYMYSRSDLVSLLHYSEVCHKQTSFLCRKTPFGNEGNLNKDLLFVNMSCFINWKIKCKLELSRPFAWQKKTAKENSEYFSHSFYSFTLKPYTFCWRSCLFAILCSGGHLSIHTYLLLLQWQEGVWSPSYETTTIREKESNYRSWQEPCGSQVYNDISTILLES